MEERKDHYLRSEIAFPTMPLAVYRELAAIMRQVEGVETGLLPQQSHFYDYNQSQVGGLWIQHDLELASIHRQRLEQILSYYGDRYGPWQKIN